MSGEKLLPCWHCGGDAEVSYGIGDYDYDGGDRWRFYNARVTCRCGAKLDVENNGDEYLPLERALDFAAEAWNNRVAVADHDFAMAVHDGELWGKCSECKERKGYYLDAETIQRQQERIAELERSLEHYRLEVICYENDVDRRDALIRDLWECLSAHIESAINDGGIGYDYKPQERGCGESCTVNGEDCSMSLMERRMRELGNLKEGGDD